MNDLISLQCPVCRTSLISETRTFRCANGHSFDLANEGYLNLLLSHQRRSAHPGDDAEMILARRRFFDSGAYDPLVAFIQKNCSGRILDAGCGEGSISGTLTGTVIGADISKEAVRAAAKRFKDATWVVANVMRELPFADQSMDVILSILAPRNPQEFARILKPDGRLLLVVPGPDHLKELRAQLSTGKTDFDEKADEAAAKCAPLFIEAHRESLIFTLTLNREQIADLIRMTPIFWCSGPKEKAGIQQLEQLTVTAGFVLLELKRA